MFRTNPVMSQSSLANHTPDRCRFSCFDGTGSWFYMRFLPLDTFSHGEPRVLGLAMIPGHHVVSIEVEADSLEDADGFGACH